MPELDAHIHVVQSNANALAAMSGSLLTRAEEAGFSLEDEHVSASPELKRGDVKAYVIGRIADILNARKQAAKLLDQMEAVESHLEILLDAAKSQYRAYDGVLRLIEQADNLNPDGVAEVELAGRLGLWPRRESILLMCRNMQRQ